MAKYIVTEQQDRAEHDKQYKPKLLRAKGKKIKLGLKFPPGYNPNRSQEQKIAYLQKLHPVVPGKKMTKVDGERKLI